MSYPVATQSSERSALAPSKDTRTEQATPSKLVRIALGSLNADGERRWFCGVRAGSELIGRMKMLPESDPPCSVGDMIESNEEDPQMITFTPPGSRVLSLNLSDMYFCDDDLSLIFKQFPQAQNVELTGCLSLTDKCFRHIKELPSIRSLDVSGLPHLTGAGLKNLEGLSLEVLKLARTNLYPGEGPRSLGKLGLKSLDINDCNEVTDGCIVCIAENKSLEDLNIRRLRWIGDQALEALSTLPKLNNLTMTYGTGNFTCDGMTSFKERRPDVKFFSL